MHKSTFNHGHDSNADGENFDGDEEGSASDDRRDGGVEQEQDLSPLGGNDAVLRPHTMRAASPASSSSNFPTPYSPSSSAASSASSQLVGDIDPSAIFRTPQRSSIRAPVGPPSGARSEPRPRPLKSTSLNFDDVPFTGITSPLPSSSSSYGYGRQPPAEGGQGFPPNGVSRTGAGFGLSRGFDERVRDFYHQHNPSKCSEVEQILSKYRGREDELVRRLEKQYNTTFPL